MRVCLGKCNELTPCQWMSPPYSGMRLVPSLSLMLMLLLVRSPSLAVLINCGLAGKATHLDLSDQNISEDVIVNVTLVDCDAVVTLDLSYNRITTIPPHGLRAFHNITELVLDFNRIRTLSRESFDGVPKLTRLSLRSNPLLNLSADAFDELNQLQAHRSLGHSPEPRDTHPHCAAPSGTGYVEQQPDVPAQRHVRQPQQPAGTRPRDGKATARRRGTPCVGHVQAMCRPRVGHV